MGSFYDWLGQEPPVGPERGVGFDVVPDDQAADVELRREARRRAFEELERAPGLAALFHPEFWPEAVRPMMALQPAGKLDELVTLHKGILREGVETQWRQLRAIELLVAEAQEAFDGEDPCLPDVRHTLDHTREQLVDIHESLQSYVEPFDLPEPDEDEVAQLRALAERPGVSGGDLPLRLLPPSRRANPSGGQPCGIASHRYEVIAVEVIPPREVVGLQLRLRRRASIESGRRGLLLRAS